jgi:hypothetical protein
MLAMMMVLTGLTYRSWAAERNMSRVEAEFRVNEIRQRVEDIRAMDFSQLTATERHAVKYELRDMKKELVQMGPYIYISTGALIIIIVLLLLLL